MEEYDIQDKNIEIGNFIENILPEITLRCLSKIKSTFLVLHNSFFTITNKDLVVLKCFISKNSNDNITKLLPRVGSNIKEESSGQTSIFRASMENATVQRRNNFDNKDGNVNVESIATPIKYKNDVIGYIGLTTLNNELVKILHIFIESLSINIERELEKVFIQKDIIQFINLINIKHNEGNINYLSAKEELISKYMLMAYSNSEIADTLSISESTVKTYLRRIYEKCGTSNRVDTTIAIICGSILEKL